MKPLMLTSRTSCVLPPCSTVHLGRGEGGEEEGGLTTMHPRMQEGGVPTVYASACGEVGGWEGIATCGAMQE